MQILMLSVALAATPIRFHPNAGAETVEVDVTGRISGVRVQIVGTVLAHAMDLAALEALPQVKAVTPIRPGDAVVVVVPADGIDVGELSRILHARDDVRWAHPDLILPTQPRFVPNDPYLVDQWHIENIGQRGYTPGVDINAKEAWDITDGTGQIVAVFDTGSDPTHPDLDVIVGWDYIDGDADSSPVGDDPHGTSVAGLAAGLGNNGIGTTGVAFGAQVYSVRVIGGATSLGDIYTAFVEAVDAGASVLNNSWGYDDGCGEIPTYSVYEDMMAYAEDEGRDGYGSVVVFSAGNGDCDITNDGLQAIETVFSVAASNGWDYKESYSSFGPWVDITAPSGNIATTDIVGSLGYPALHGNNSYTGTFSGTSASAPEISGVFALMFAANERLTAKDAREVMCTTAVRMDLQFGDWNEDGWSPYYGCGRVDAGAAVRAVANEGGPDVPEILGPEPQLITEVGGARLEWTKPNDPDGDELNYIVRWWYEDDPGNVIKVDSTRKWIELTPEEAPIGARIAWKVRAGDLWGTSDWTDDQLFEVVEPVDTSTPPPAVRAGGCSTTGGSSSWMWLPLLLVVGRRRARGSKSGS